MNSCGDLPSDVLKAEHETILRVLGVLQRLMQRYESGDGFEAEDLGRCVQFFKLFADKCHHAKEEDILFPALEKKGIPREGGPIGVMIQEHEIARGLTREMAKCLDPEKASDEATHARFAETAKQYMELLSNHIQKENDCLFPMGDQVLTDDDQKSLCTRFCESGCPDLGGIKHDDLEKLANDLEAQWPGEPLSANVECE